MEKFEYHATWCDYYPDCPYRQGIQIGSYECTECDHFDGACEEKNPEFDKLPKCDYKKYSIHKAEGVVWCTYKEK